MEIDVTDYVACTEHSEISGSVAERGQNAAQETWANARAESAKAPILPTHDDCDEARAWLREFGAWSEEELAAYPDDDIRALVLQFISGDVREAQSSAPGGGPADIDWGAYEVMQASGTCSSYLFCATDGRIYFDMQ